MEPLAVLGVRASGRIGVDEEEGVELGGVSSPCEVWLVLDLDKGKKKGNWLGEKATKTSTGRRTRVGVSTLPLSALTPDL